MKEKIVTVISEFTDFRGEIHKFVVAAVSMQVDAEVEIYNDSEVAEWIPTEKTVRLGVAICNPVDEYSEEKEKFEKRQEFAKKLAELTEEEKAVYNAMKDHKYPKVEALLNA